jgi:anti-sigma regulatory factor (Ser/Thr protein kinase)
MTEPRTVRLQPRPTSVRAARALVGDTLDHAGVPDEQVEAVRLVVSELVTNAVVHGDGDVELCLDLDQRCVRISVADEDDGAPSPVDADPGAVSGRGLRLVDEIADRWGTAPRSDGRPGKTVWAELRF